MKESNGARFKNTTRSKRLRGNKLGRKKNNFLWRY